MMLDDLSAEEKAHLDWLDEQYAEYMDSLPDAEDEYPEDWSEGYDY